MIHIHDNLTEELDIENYPVRISIGKSVRLQAVAVALHLFFFHPKKLDEGMLEA